MAHRFFFFLAAFFAAAAFFIPDLVYGYFFPFIFGIISPLRFVGPVSCAHLALGNVLGVTGLERFTTSLLGFCFGVAASTANALLTESYKLNLLALLRQNRMALSRMFRRSLRLVVAAELFPGSGDCHVTPPSR